MMLWISPYMIYINFPDHIDEFVALVSTSPTHL